MPLYEYECQQCHRHTEKRQKFSDPEITQCPHCGGPLERVISAPAFSFAGGGWYKDLYSSAKPGSAGKETGGSSEAGNSETKSASDSGSAAPASTSTTAPSSTASPAPAPAASPSTKP